MDLLVYSRGDVDPPSNGLRAAARALSDTRAPPRSAHPTAPAADWSDLSQLQRARRDRGEPDVDGRRPLVPELRSLVGRLRSRRQAALAAHSCPPYGTIAAVSESAVSVPAPALRPFITRYAGFRHSGLTPGVHIGHPSSEVDLIISLGPRFDVLQMPNSTQRPASFAALVSGMQDAPALVRQGSEVCGIHVFIKPLGVPAILGVGSAAITSLVVELSDIWGRTGDDLIDRLAAAETWPQRFRILDRAFLSTFNPASVAP
jgi:hypothetical protein